MKETAITEKNISGENAAPCGTDAKKEIIRARGLCKEFVLDSGVQQILKDIDLSVYEGDFTVIMGSSGSGKSTLLYGLSGMDTVSRGEIFFGGRDITKLSSDELALFRKENCGFVFQQICLIPSLSVLENVLIGGLLGHNVDKKQLTKKAKDLLHEVGIEDHTFAKYPSQISGGKAQRVGIVRALINEPGILFADEPTGALNYQTGREVLDLFTKFNDEGQSVIMVTHDLKSALRGNRILYLKDGRILSSCDLGRYRDGENDERKNKLLSFLDEMGW